MYIYFIVIVLTKFVIPSYHFDIKQKKKKRREVMEDKNKIKNKKNRLY